MKVTSIEWWALSLTIVSLGAIATYLDASRAILMGGAYLGAALFFSAFSVFHLFNLKVRMKRNSMPQSMWLLQTRAQILMLVAWQLAIVGLLNIWSIDTLKPLSILLLSDCLVALCVFTWDRLISIADNSSQDGGPQPLSSRGRPRSRRFAFWVFFVYPLSSLVLAGVMIFAQGTVSPLPFHPPQISLLIDALFSIGAAGMIFQRYRKVPASQTFRPPFLRVWLLAACAAAGFQLLVGWSLYINVLSIVILGCLTLSTYYMWRARNTSLPPRRLTARCRWRAQI